MILMKRFAVVVVVEGGKCAIVVVVDAVALLAHGSKSVNNRVSR